MFFSSLYKFTGIFKIKIKHVISRFVTLPCLHNFSTIYFYFSSCREMLFSFILLNSLFRKQFPAFTSVFVFIINKRASQFSRRTGAGATDDKLENIFVPEQDKADKNKNTITFQFTSNWQKSSIIMLKFRANSILQILLLFYFVIRNYLAIKRRDKRCFLMLLKILRISNKGLSVRKNYIFPLKPFYIHQCENFKVSLIIEHFPIFQI